MVGWAARSQLPATSLAGLDEMNHWNLTAMIAARMWQSPPVQPSRFSLRQCLSKLRRCDLRHDDRQSHERPITTIFCPCEEKIQLVRRMMREAAHWRTFSSPSSLLRP